MPDETAAEIAAALSGTAGFKERLPQSVVFFLTD
jgi:hypothetical protein